MKMKDDRASRDDNGYHANWISWYSYPIYQVIFLDNYKLSIKFQVLNGYLSSTIIY